MLAISLERIFCTILQLWSCCSAKDHISWTLQLPVSCWVSLVWIIFICFSEDYLPRRPREITPNGRHQERNKRYVIVSAIPAFIPCRWCSRSEREAQVHAYTFFLRFVKVRVCGTREPNIDFLYNVIALDLRSDIFSCQFPSISVSLFVLPAFSFVSLTFSTFAIHHSSTSSSLNIP